MNELQSPQLEWGNGPVRSVLHDDIYHSSAGAMEQSEAVFLQGNDLPQRFSENRPFVILETGFGLGVNFLMAWRAWRQWHQDHAVRTHGAIRMPPRLHFISVEKYPLSRLELERALSAFSELKELSAQLVEQWPPRVSGAHHLEFEQGHIVLTLHLGDVMDVMGTLRTAADAIFLDGFTPERNPEMWSPALMRQLARQCHPGTTLASWCVAGHVRRALMHEGFNVEKEAGFGGKRHRLVARFNAIPQEAFLRMNTPGRNRTLFRRMNPLPREAVILGAGLAGCLMAEALCRRGWQVKLLERHALPAQEASGNRAGIFRPFVSVDDNEHSQLCRAGFLFSAGLLQRLHQATGLIEMKESGVLHLADSSEEAQRFAAAVENAALPPEFVRLVTPAEAQTIAGQSANFGGLFFPRAGWVHPSSLCRAALKAAGEHLETHWNTEVAGIAPDNGGWELTLANGQKLSTPTLILALGSDPRELYPNSPDLVRIRGQVTLCGMDPFPANTPVLCQDGYVISGLPEGVCVGASFDVADPDPEARADSQQENLQRLKGFYPNLECSKEQLSDRVGFRTMAKNRLPLCGEAAPGLYTLMGLGSHGLIWAGLLAEQLARELEG
jgi:tRNA 5-methylaminomethyl-2-thiouridine biosynthesis bifunctional protein